MRYFTLPLSLVLLVATLTACARGPAPAPSPTSPIGFPLFGGSTVLSVHDWHRTLSRGERTALGIIGTRGGAYGGYEVVTATDAPFDQVTAWLHRLNRQPPAGYHVTLWGSGVDDARDNARSIGLDFGVFGRVERGVAHDVVVVAVDPDRLQQKAGFALSMLGKFQRLPAFLRSSIDAQARAQTGFTVSDAVDPSTPIGAAVEALGSLHDAHSRGVIFIDARRIDARH